MRQTSRSTCPERTLSKEDAAFQNRDFPQRGTSPGASTPWSAILALIGFVGLCLLVAAVDGAMTARSLRTWYLTLAQPPGTPPGAVFAPVWVCLYVMLGVAGWLVWRRVGAAPPVRLWGWQLLANAMWAPAFFGLRSPLGGLAVMGFVAVLSAVLVARFRAIHLAAAWLLVPYIFWILYATYLAAGFWWLNRGLGVFA